VPHSSAKLLALLLRTRIPRAPPKIPLGVGWNHVSSACNDLDSRTDTHTHFHSNSWAERNINTPGASTSLRAWCAARRPHRAGPQSQLDQSHGPALRKAGQALVPNRRCLVVSQRRPTTLTRRLGAGSPRPPPRRLLLLPRPHPHRHTNSGAVFPALAPGGLLPRRQAISGLRRSPESRSSGHHAHRSPDLLSIRSGLTLVRAGEVPIDGSPSSTVCGICERPRFLLRTFFGPYVTRPGRRGFSTTPLWMRTPENPPTLCGMGKSTGIKVQNSRLETSHDLRYC